jgi:hypothetical protein
MPADEKSGRAALNGGIFAIQASFGVSIRRDSMLGGIADGLCQT